MSCLQRHLGLRYNPAKAPEDVPLDANDTFIMGAVFGDGGTCCSIPVVTAAVGRRLGYPIKFVTAQGKRFSHGFARWDDPATGTRFNMDGHRGLASRPDDDYRTGDYAVTPEQEKQWGVLKSKTATEELAWFLVQRSHRFLELGRTRQAVEPYGFALGLVPENGGHYANVCKLLIAWHEANEARKPPGFPDLYFSPFPPPRVYPRGVPDKIEGYILQESATEMLLDDPASAAFYRRISRSAASFPEYVWQLSIAGDPPDTAPPPVVYDNTTGIMYWGRPFSKQEGRQIVGVYWDQAGVAHFFLGTLLPR